MALFDIITQDNLPHRFFEFFYLGMMYKSEN